MEQLLIKLLAFIVAVSVLVTVHEFGHFWVARRVGVKVLRFSIGFGRALWSWRGKDGVEYVIAALPLGGYVKMVDEREGEVAEQDLPQAFNRQPLWARTAIVVAGPLANFLFAILAFWLIAVIGEVKLRPMVGTVTEQSVAAQAGFRADDEITAVNGRATPTWSKVIFELAVGSLARDEAIRFQVLDANGDSQTRTVPAGAIGDLADRNPFEVLGLKRASLADRVPAEIGELVPGKPAEQAGLRPGDRIIAADGETIPSWLAWWKYVRERPEQPIVMTVQRDGGHLELTVVPAAVEEEDRIIGQVGAVNAPPPKALTEQFYVYEQWGLAEAVPYALWETMRLSGLVLDVMFKIVTGEASINNLSGPISIANFAGQTAQLGLVPFLSLMAMISVSLGVLNLLPIPVLDGGHLVYFAYEGLVGRPPSEQMMLHGQQLGMAVLFGIMLLALYVDLSRHLG